MVIESDEDGPYKRLGPVRLVARPCVARPSASSSSPKGRKRKVLLASIIKKKGGGPRGKAYVDKTGKSIFEKGPRLNLPKAKKLGLKLKPRRVTKRLEKHVPKSGVVNKSIVSLAESYMQRLDDANVDDDDDCGDDDDSDDDNGMTDRGDDTNEHERGVIENAHGEGEGGGGA